MKKLSGILLFALALALVLPSCGKYEEGPSLSCRSKKARLVNEWKIDKYYENAIDITATFTSYEPNLLMNIKEDGTIVNTYSDPSGVPVSWASTWEFNSDKSGVVITTGGVSSTFDILRLKNDELWLKQSISTLGITTIKEIHYITN